MPENDSASSFSQPELQELADTWLAEIRGNQPEESEAGEAVVSMNFTASPQIQWQFILIAVSLAESDDELSYVAAGPIEHLLGWHGEDYLSVVEKEAATNAKFARTLTGVWRYLMSDEVWLRVQRLKELVSDPLRTTGCENNTAEANSPTYKTWIMLLDKEKEDGFNSLSDEEKTFYHVYLLEHEAYGGGLEVWFDLGEHHNQAVTALRDIGADKSAGIIEDALKFVFPEGIAPLDLAARQSYIPDYDDANRAWFTSLDRFDHAYRDDPDNLEQLLITYARGYNFLVE